MITEVLPPAGGGTGTGCFKHAPRPRRPVASASRGSRRRSTTRRCSRSVTRCSPPRRADRDAGFPGCCRDAHPGTLLTRHTHRVTRSDRHARCHPRARRRLRRRRRTLRRPRLPSAHRARDAGRAARHGLRRRPPRRTRRVPAAGRGGQHRAAVPCAPAAATEQGQGGLRRQGQGAADRPRGGSPGPLRGVRRPAGAASLDHPAGHRHPGPFGGGPRGAAAADPPWLARAGRAAGPAATGALAGPAGTGPSDAQPAERPDGADPGAGERHPPRARGGLQPDHRWRARPGRDAHRGRRLRPLLPLRVAVGDRQAAEVQEGRAAPDLPTAGAGDRSGVRPRPVRRRPLRHDLPGGEGPRRLPGVRRGHLLALRRRVPRDRRRHPDRRRRRAARPGRARTLPRSTTSSC